ncbi:hypothetical protein JCM8795_16610 [Hydrogenobaculum acidophilum]
MEVYFYSREDYDVLLRALSQKNSYQYGLVLPRDEKINLSGKKRGVYRVFRTVNETIILCKKPAIGEYKLVDIKQKPLYLVPVILVWDEKYKRIRCQINRDYVRDVIKAIEHYSENAYLYPQHKKGIREYMYFVNRYTKMLLKLCNDVFVYQETRYAYDKKVKKIVLRFLTTVLHYKKDQAMKKIDKYLVKLQWRPYVVNRQPDRKAI